MSRQFGLFAKRPRAGQVKTRLAADLGDEPAAEIYAAVLHDLVERFQSAGDRRVLGHAPGDDESQAYFKDLCGDNYELWPQPNTDLGGRMAAFFATGFASGMSQIVLIGSDSPTLPREYVDIAFEKLEQSDCVIGPASDGGYYLIGLRQPPGDLFTDIDWSGERVLSQTVERLREAGFSLQLLPAWYDVDTVEDLHALRGHLAAMRLAGNAEFAARTFAMVEKHIANSPPNV